MHARLWSSSGHAADTRFGALGARPVWRATLCAVILGLVSGCRTQHGLPEVEVKSQPSLQQDVKLKQTSSAADRAPAGPVATQARVDACGAETGSMSMLRPAMLQDDPAIVTVPAPQITSINYYGAIKEDTQPLAVVKLVYDAPIVGKPRPTLNYMFRGDAARFDAADMSTGGGTAIELGVKTLSYLWGKDIGTLPRIVDNPQPSSDTALTGPPVAVMRVPWPVAIIRTVRVGAEGTQVIVDTRTLSERLDPVTQQWITEGFFDVIVGDKRGIHRVRVTLEDGTSIDAGVHEYIRVTYTNNKPKAEGPREVSQNGSPRQYETRETMLELAAAYDAKP